MNTRKFTLEIYPSECVGDSAGKHNFNTLSLDTVQCNLSSIFFETKDNVLTKFLELQQFIPSLQQITSLYQNPFRYNSIYSAVNLLSSYWEKQEFSVYYPLNISSLQTIVNRRISAPTVNTPDDLLISLCNNYLNSNFPHQQYNDNAIVNVNLFLYSNNRPNSEVVADISPPFSFNNRNMTGLYTKESKHFAQSKIFKFINSNQQWEYIGKASEWNLDPGIPFNSTNPVPNPPPPTVPPPPPSSNEKVAELTTKANKLTHYFKWSNQTKRFQFLGFITIRTPDDHFPPGDYLIRYKKGAFWNSTMRPKRYAIGSFEVFPVKRMGGIPKSQRTFATPEAAQNFGLNFAGNISTLTQQNSRPYTFRFSHPGGRIGLKFLDSIQQKSTKFKAAPRIGLPVWELIKIN
jgi:hypothetical protein